VCFAARASSSLGAAVSEQLGLSSCKRGRHVAAVKERKEAGPRLAKAEKALQDAAGRLEGFLAGPAVSFAELRTRTVAFVPKPWWTLTMSTLG